MNDACQNLYFHKHKKCATDIVEETSFIKLIQSKRLTTIYPELYK